MNTDTAGIFEINIDDLDAIDVADMTVVINGKLTDWIWQFAGPGHPQAIEQKNRMARERMLKERQQEQAQVNGKKWKAPEETLDEVRLRNIGVVVGRLIGWSPIKINGELLPFTPKAAQDLLVDPRKEQLLTQAFEFLASEDSFTRRSA